MKKSKIWLLVLVMATLVFGEMELTSRGTVRDAQGEDTGLSRAQFEQFKNTYIKKARDLGIDDNAQGAYFMGRVNILKYQKKECPYYLRSVINHKIAVIGLVEYSSRLVPKDSLFVLFDPNDKNSLTRRYPKPFYKIRVKNIFKGQEILEEKKLLKDKELNFVYGSEAIDPTLVHGNDGFNGDDGLAAHGNLCLLFFDIDKSGSSLSLNATPSLIINDELQIMTYTGYFSDLKQAKTSQNEIDRQRAIHFSKNHPNINLSSDELIKEVEEFINSVESKEIFYKINFDKEVVSE